MEAKLPEYRRRGDAEISRLHPLERTLTRWVRRPDGGYSEELLSSGIVQFSSLPGVSIDLAELW